MMKFLRTVAVALVALPAAAACKDAGDRPPHDAANESGLVTTVSGPSVLSRFGLSVDATRFGQLGGTMPPPATARQEPMPALAPEAETAPPFAFTGADLYRVSCQSCHGPDGNGAPPEINSLVGPVQGTSAALLTERMRKGSHPIDPSFLKSMADGAEQDLRQRLREGGKKMPSFAYLTDPDVDTLIAQLQRMVGIPEAATSEGRLTLAAARVGEVVVKGTCHICHDATGPGRQAMMMQSGIPSLASMPVDESFDQLAAKVREGIAPPARMMMMRTGPARMPKLPYLTGQELAAAMQYIRGYPPQR